MDFALDMQHPKNSAFNAKPLLHTLFTPTSVWLNHLLANSKCLRRPFLHLHGLIRGMELI